MFLESLPVFYRFFWFGEMLPSNQQDCNLSGFPSFRSLAADLLDRRHLRDESRPPGRPDVVRLPENIQTLPIDVREACPF